MRAAVAAAVLAAVALPARADQYDAMRERFPLYPPVCAGSVECVANRMQAWFGRTFEVHTGRGAGTGLYLVRRGPDGALIEFVLVGEF